MSTQKKSIIYLAFLLVFCTILAGCAVYAETAIYEPYMQISSFLSSSNSNSEFASPNTVDINSSNSESESVRNNSSEAESVKEKSNQEENETVQFNNKNKPEKQKSAKEKLEAVETTSKNEESPSLNVDITPTLSPTLTLEPTSLLTPTSAPTKAPSPTSAPTKAPSPTLAPTKAPSPTLTPTKAPSPTLEPTKAPSPTTAPVNSSAIVLDNLIGKSNSYIVEQFGNPVAIEKSEYGFYWHVYHKNYTGFVMIGILNDKVVGLYSNSSALSLESLKVGSSKSAVRSALSNKYTGPTTFIQKGNTRYNLTNTDQKDIFYDSNKYITVFYDNINGGTLTSVQIIDYNTEQSFGYFPTPSKEYSDSYEKISFYLINSIRVRFKLPVLIYDNNMAKIAAAHSQDMIDRNFFSHTNPDGLKNADRIKAAGYSYRRCAENIAKNHPTAINAHEAYMNSSGHRSNILLDVKYVGIGVRMVQGSILQTQVFITYP